MPEAWNPFILPVVNYKLQFLNLFIELLHLIHVIFVYKRLSYAKFSACPVMHIYLKFYLPKQELSCRRLSGRGFVTPCIEPLRVLWRYSNATVNSVVIQPYVTVATNYPHSTLNGIAACSNLCACGAALY